MRGLSLVLVIAVVAAPAGAQTTRNAQRGFWIGADAGIGTTGTQCSGCASDPLDGGFGLIRLGVTLTPGVLVGGEISALIASESNTLQDAPAPPYIRHSFAAATLNLTWYPDHNSTLHLAAGVGAMRYHSWDGYSALTDLAPVLTLGIGFDIRLAHHLSLAPFASAYQSTPVSSRINGVHVSTFGVRRYVAQAGLGITFH